VRASEVFDALIKYRGTCFMSYWFLSTGAV
jgi:hypothetical protein